MNVLCDRKTRLRSSQVNWYVAAGDETLLLRRDLYTQAIKHHHAREVRKAAKKAKTFEVQKTVKKLKGLRSVLLVLCYGQVSC